MRAPRHTVPWSRGRVQRRGEYAAYMDSPAWFDRRERWVQEWQERHPQATLGCAVCGTPWRLDHGDLHHATYRHLGGERFEDLVALCRLHHEQLHRIYESSPAWRRLGRQAATVAIIAQLRTRLASTREDGKGQE